jgi:hypothetical protein
MMSLYFEGQWGSNENILALVLKSATIWGRGLKNISDYVKLFMDDPFGENRIVLNFRSKQIPPFIYVSIGVSRVY